MFQYNVSLESSECIPYVSNIFVSKVKVINNWEICCEGKSFDMQLTIHFLHFRHSVNQKAMYLCLMLTILMTWRNFDPSASLCQLARRRWEEVDDLLPADVPPHLPSAVVLTQKRRHRHLFSRFTVIIKWHDFIDVIMQCWLLISESVILLCFAS